MNEQRNSYVQVHVQANHKKITGALCAGRELRSPGVFISRPNYLLRPFFVERGTFYHDPSHRLAYGFHASIIDTVCEFYSRTDGSKASRELRTRDPAARTKASRLDARRGNVI